MNLEKSVNYYLNYFPGIKRVVKRAYQIVMYSVSRKIKSEGNLVRMTPDDGYEYFFGYYDKSPWDISDRYMLCLRAKNAHSDVAPKEPADILLIDTQNNHSIRVLASTNTWNVQQGCMLQWLGPDYSSNILYNDLVDGQYCSVIFNLETSDKKIIPFPVYSVSPDGSFALSLDFSRLHRLRKGYGYSNLEDSTKDELCPDKPCIWHVDLKSGKIKPVLRYTDFLNFETRTEMIGAEHKVNHVMISPDGKRFMVLHRWFKGSRKYTRLVTSNLDGTDLYNLSDEDMVSHCCWKNNQQILAFERKKESGIGYYLMKDRTDEYERLWPDLSSDGHPSYSPDGKYIVTDTYPNRSRIAAVYLLNRETRQTVARVFAPFRYDNDLRCDLHPRWNHAGDSICIDSVFEGNRQLYTINIRQYWRCYESAKRDRPCL